MVSTVARVTPNFTKLYHYNRREEYREDHRILKQQVLDHYGRKCACCGERRIEFLSIDHIEGGGNQHRKRIKISLYKDLRRNNFPAGYRVLCMNCNHALGHYGECPHRKGKITKCEREKRSFALFNDFFDTIMVPKTETYDNHTGRRID